MILAVAGVLALPSAAQNSLAEDAWTFAQSYDQAIVENNIAFLEEHLDDGFISVGPNSLIMYRNDALEQARQIARDRNNAAFRVSELNSTPVKIEASGNIVVITSNWRVVRTGTAAVNTLPQVHTGTTTAVYRKLDDWQILSEHVSFDRPKMVDNPRIIGELGQVYSRMLTNRNLADVDKFLTNNYLRTDENGQRMDKTGFIDAMRDSILGFTTIKNTGVYINSFDTNAVETGISEVSGMRNGDRFTERYQYTRSWVKLNDEWKIFAEHYSQIRDQQ